MGFCFSLSSSKGFGGSKTERADESPSKLASDDPVSGISEGDRKWKLTPFDTDEWQVRRRYT